MADIPVDAEEARGSFETLGRRLMEGISGPLGPGAGLDPAALFRSLAQGLALDPERWLEIQNRYYRKRIELWAAYARPRPVAPPTTM